AYVIIAPLDSNDRIDSTLWREHREACRIARLRPGQQDRSGHLVHRQGGGWAFHYSAPAKMPDEVGFHSRMSHLHPANMSRSMKAARCTPTVSYRYTACNHGGANGD